LQYNLGCIEPSSSIDQSSKSTAQGNNAAKAAVLRSKPTEANMGALTPSSAAYSCC
jgi:hypothetical protein